MVFTMEVAISTMPKNVEQFVMLFDASKWHTHISQNLHIAISSKTFLIDQKTNE